jgi:hypothetical protein
MRQSVSLPAFHDKAKDDRLHVMLPARKAIRDVILYPQLKPK